MKKYYDEACAPLRFYRFLKGLSAISAILSIFTTFVWLTSWNKSPLFYTSPLFWGDVFFRFSCLISIFIAAVNLSVMRWIGVLAYGAYLILISGHMAFLKIASINNASVIYTITVQALALLVYLIPYSIYFYKRRPLFTPKIAEITPSGAPQEENTSAANSPVVSSCHTEPPNQKDISAVDEVDSAQAKEESRAFRRHYETYVVCPACGLLVAKGAKSCDCGFDFSTPLQKFLKRTKKYIAYFVLLAIIAALTVSLFTKDAELQAANARIDFLTEKRDSLAISNSSLRKRIDQLEQEFSALKAKCDDCFLCNRQLPSLQLPSPPLPFSNP